MSKNKTKANGNNGLTRADNFFIVDLRQLKSNTCQPRRNGVIPNLNELGYGLFSQEEETVNADKIKNDDNTAKLPLMTMLLSDKPDLWAFAVGLVDQHEPEVKELANSILVNGQLQNIGIVAIEGGGYDICYGCCRSIARAYNFARSAGEVPCNIKAEVAQDYADPMALHFWAMAENSGRRKPSLIDEAKQIQFLKRSGKSVSQIAEQMCTNQQNVRNRLKLLRLTAEEQQRVHTGKLGMVKANQIVDKRDRDGTKPGETAPDKAEDRKRMPTLKQSQTGYTALEKPEAMSEEEWAIWTDAGFRKGVAYFMGVEYKSHRDMVADAKRADKAKLDEAIRIAAEQAEATDTPAAAAK
jgi:ParB-like nuclease domain